MKRPDVVDSPELNNIYNELERLDKQLGTTSAQGMPPPLPLPPLQVFADSKPCACAAVTDGRKVLESELDQLKREIATIKAEYAKKEWVHSELDKRMGVLETQLVVKYQELITSMIDCSLLSLSLFTHPSPHRFCFFVLLPAAHRGGAASGSIACGRGSGVRRCGLRLWLRPDRSAAQSARRSVARGGAAHRPPNGRRSARQTARRRQAR